MEAVPIFEGTPVLVGVAPLAIFSYCERVSGRVLPSVVLVNAHFVYRVGL